MSGTDAHAAPANCENCATPLQGPYCHACGQSLHSPTRHFGHAVEEVFESFWHLDGRVFRTLRDLMVPGRVARNYLAGQRVRYIAPLRLFVILSLLTFFVGQLVVHVDGDRVGFDGREAAIGRAQTVAEVERVRDTLLGELAVAEKERAKMPGVDMALVAARARIEGEAASRIAELERQGPGARTPAARTAPVAASEASVEAPVATSAVPATAGAAKPDPATVEGEDDWNFNGRPWDAKANPVDAALLPAIGDRWLNQKIGNARRNMDLYEGEPQRFVQAFMGTLPTALFLLMPVFALLLKTVYLGSGRGYLEHMVVALYSHVWLLLVLLAMFLLSAVDDAFAAAWVGALTGVGYAALWLWMPVYLFLMQRRVYGEHWALATVRYLVIGTVYVLLVSFAVAFAVLAGVSS